MHLSLDINFDKKILSGKVDLEVEKINHQANELVCYKNTIFSVYIYQYFSAFGC